MRLPLVTKPFSATVTLPGSKSLTNRALLLAAMAKGTSTLRRVLICDDTLVMMNCLRALGVQIDLNEATCVATIKGTNSKLRAGPLTLFANQSGTTARFILPLLSLGEGPYTLDAHPQMRDRPMAELVNALGQLHIQTSGERLPITVDAGPTSGRSVRLSATTSSQFTSAMLMLAPLLPTGLKITLEGEAVSQPYLHMTTALMNLFGAQITPSSNGYDVLCTGYKATDYTIEPDASTASYFFALAAITQSTITVKGLFLSSLQGDTAFVFELQRMGAALAERSQGLTITGPAHLSGVHTNLSQLSDTAPTLAVVAAVATGSSTIDGIGFIRKKESDRISAVASNLQTLGLHITEDPDGWTITPSSLVGGSLPTFNDHRIAMSFAILGCVVPELQLLNPQCVSKTFPGFFTTLANLVS